MEKKIEKAIRDLKFRVWTSFGMFHNVSVHDGDTFGMSNDDFYKTAKKPKDQEEDDWDDLFCEYNFMDCGEDWLQGDGQITQFTGLSDKFGKEIYEGDIMGWESYEGTPHQIRWVVEFNAQRGYKTWSSSKNDEVVIGNIYENPELLHTGA